MNNISDGSNMAVYRMRENLIEIEMKFFAICMDINGYFIFIK